MAEKLMKKGAIDALVKEKAQKEMDAALKRKAEVERKVARLFK